MIIYLIGIIYFASYLQYVLVFAFRKRRLLENFLKISKKFI